MYLMVWKHENERLFKNHQYAADSFFILFSTILLTEHYLFQQIDTNKDGVVTIDELVEWCSKNDQILQSLETLDTVL